MWTGLSIFLLVLELLVIGLFIVGRIRKKKLSETLPFLGMVFVVNFLLNLLPMLYNRLVLQAQSNIFLDLFDCIMNTVQMFLGEAESSAAADFAEAVPLFSFVFLLGACIALLATISTALVAFHNTLRNGLLLARMRKKPACDIVLGCGEAAKAYARDRAAILMLGDDIDRDTALALMEDGYAVLRRNFSKEFLASPLLCRDTRYAIIVPKDCSNSLECLNAFVDHYQNEKKPKNLHLYLEAAGDQAATIHRQIIEQNALEDVIRLFSAEELLARTFVEAHPATEYLPKDFIESDASIRADAKVQIVYLGFGKLSRELYRQSLLNNNFVSYQNGRYTAHPVHYYLYDAEADFSDWNIGGLKAELAECEMERERFFPLPEMGFVTAWEQASPMARATLLKVKKTILQEDTFTYVMVDTGDSYSNMEIGAKLRSLLCGAENYHCYIQSDAACCEDDGVTTYYGNLSTVYTHDIIVNDALSLLARKLNELYTAQSMADQKARADFAKLVQQKAEETWKNFDYFTLFSNIYSAVSLRLKLQLLGLDYVKNGRAEGLDLIARRYPQKAEYDYEAYAERSVRNALLAQEHARWNAYHLLQEYLPLRKADITVKSSENGKVRFVIKHTDAKKHACLTTFRGLDDLSCYLAEKATELSGRRHTAREYDYYQYDEMLLSSAQELLKTLSFSVIEKETKA